MDWLENLNRAMDYIEGHLEGEISYDRAAQLAGCSKYHLLRMFPYLTGVSLSEYIRRRRLTLAAFALQDGGLKVIDAALQYGYESPEAFSRAFKALHGVSPDQAKRGDGALAACPRMSFHISVKGENQMKYRMTHREGFRVFGVWAEVSSDMQAAFQQVPAFCRRCDKDGTVDKLNHLLGRFSDNYTLSALYGHTEDSFRYMLCNFLPQGLALPRGLPCWKCRRRTGRYSMCRAARCRRCVPGYTASGSPIRAMNWPRGRSLGCTTGWPGTKMPSAKSGCRCARSSAGQSKLPQSTGIGGVFLPEWLEHGLEGAVFAHGLGD